MEHVLPLETAAPPGRRPDMLAMERLHQLLTALSRQTTTNLGFPDAADLDIGDLGPLLRTLLNNVGDPYGPAGPYGKHTKTFERDVVEAFADLFRAPLADRWGYTTTGSTEGTHCALWMARTRHPDTVVVCSAAAHYGVARLADMLRMPLITVPVNDRDELDYDSLATQVRARRARKRRPPAVVVVATIGTTMTEAIDDVTRIHQALDTARVARDQRWIHADAALAGIPLGLMNPADRPGFDFSNGADSLVVSGHKFLGTPLPCAVLIVRDSARAGTARHVDYIGSHDTTVTGSRSGHAPLMLWWALQTWGWDGLRRRADQSRDLAQHTVQRLTGIGWRAWRHPLAFTVVLDPPPDALLRRWPLPVSDGRAHLVCMPGKTRVQVDAFVADLVATTRLTAPGRRRPRPQVATALQASESVA
ncbi:histidine decarboxylase [Plantactinospora sp. S1510]|uniref:Histidine decarboxylase n=1 Tax=Plantactinospora alkalitolerans TaxID=2789879 RepID=A0ABS0H3E3_9ACTN|nr:histidine decarboxylase [Plantactinospora alkalitolerans]MBF9132728.1 histidine decarboxylase [Plantactinospora alkalitolerans]